MKNTNKAKGSGYTMSKNFIASYIAFSIALTIALSIILQPVHAQAATGGPNLQVKLAKYDPSPAEAGKVVTVWFDVTNRGSESASNASFAIADQYPFYLPTGGTINYGVIRGADSIRVEFKILVDKSAPEGVSKITLQYTPNGALMFDKDFNVTTVKAQNNTDQRVLFVKMEPAAYPGGTSMLTIDVVNVADGTAYYTIASVNTDVATVERSDVFVGTLEPDDFESVDYQLRFNADAQPGTYPVNVKLVYKNSDSEEITENDTVYITLFSAKDAAAQTNQQAPWIYYVIGAVIVIILIRALAHPLYKWFVKPFRRSKKGEVRA